MSGTDTTGAPTVTGDTRISLRELSMRPHDDGHGTWVIGRVVTGDFVSVPDVAHRAVLLLSAGHTVAETHRLLRRDLDADVDVADFVGSLASLGFVAAVNGVRLPDVGRPTPSFPWLEPGHVRWMLSPLTGVAVLLLTVAAMLVVVAEPALLPRYDDLIWSSSGSAVVLGNAALAWALIFLHEFAHLATARAVEVPSRMSLGTRLQFLVAQTDVSGVWAMERRTRVTVYLSGMALNLGAAATGVLVLAAAGPPDPVARLLGAFVLLSLVMIPPQLLVFMRTDVYFVMQDLFGCANLYRDGSAYARWILARLLSPWRRRGVEDPSLGLSGRERRAVRFYSVILVVGTALCLSVAAFLTLPVTVSLVVDALSRLFAGASATARLDGLLVVLALSTAQAVWARAWWRRHGPRVERRLRRAH
ncbi:hypothetical protein OG912_39870 (plasmid) [Streptomyces sp. NBC_00464]|uniref:hypothetical protein n=1 Tax=Streptomyces sp. NBC_00464 TaxID=2975751 RepID=UPI002E198274